MGVALRSFCSSIYQIDLAGVPQEGIFLRIRLENHDFLGLRFAWTATRGQSKYTLPFAWVVATMALADDED